MKFRYVKLRGTYMPYIQATLARGEEHIKTWALVDSGAGGNIFHALFAEELGIVDLKEDGMERRFEGVTGHLLKAYVHEVTIEIGGNRFANIPVAFSYDMPDTAAGIFGQEGFFELFPAVKFAFGKREVELMRGRMK